MTEQGSDGRPPTTLEALDALSRVRPLSPSEERRLQWALQRQREPERKPWTRADLRRLRSYLLRGKRPAQIAPLIGRTERAIWRKMYKLKWTVGRSAEGSIALPGRK